MIIGEWLTAGICMAMSETFRKFDPLKRKQIET
ncbi:unknown [Bacteroides sp. CAG:598]|nr:unknown [Bacteroides sp. CAG:598]